MPEWMSSIVQVACTVLPIAILMVRNDAKTQSRLGHVENDLAELVDFQKESRKAREKIWAGISRHDSRIAVVETRLDI